MRAIVTDCWHCAQRYGLAGVPAYLFNLIRLAIGDRKDSFDGRFGTATAGLAFPRDLPSLAGRADAHPYEATATSLIRTTLRGLPIRPQDFTFIDLGSGKGRALLVASDFGFGKIIGVEISRELHAVAQNNIARYETSIGADLRWELHCQDAASYGFAPEPQVLFLYNPFGRKIFDAVMTNLMASLRDHPRDVFIIYVNPRFESVLRDAEPFTKVSGGGSWLRPWARYAVYRSKFKDRP